MTDFPMPLGPESDESVFQALQNTLRCVSRYPSRQALAKTLFEREEKKNREWTQRRASTRKHHSISRPSPERCPTPANSRSFRDGITCCSYISSVSRYGKLAKLHFWLRSLSFSLSGFASTLQAMPALLLTQYNVLFPDRQQNSAPNRRPSLLGRNSLRTRCVLFLSTLWRSYSSI